jgi:transcriptional repressor NrdR
MSETVDLIIQDVNTFGSSEVHAKDVGELVMKHLKDLDEIAYVRFASVYRKFEDVDEFRAELDDI